MGEKGNAPSAAQHASQGVAPAAPRQVSGPTPAGPADQHAAPHLQAPSPPSGGADGGTVMPPIILPFPSEDRDPDEPGA